LIAARPGLRVPGAWDGFELAIRTVLGQQITVTGATSLAGKLVAAYGEPLAANVRGGNGLSHIFPRPERLAKADLSALGMPKQRAAALSALAAAVLADPQIFGVRGNLEDAIVRLRALPGVGEWTAQYIAMRELREPDAFPAADIGLLRAMSDADGRRPGPRELLARAERWRPWRAYAAHHLWASSVPSNGAKKDAAGAQPGPALLGERRPGLAAVCIAKLTFQNETIKPRANDTIFAIASGADPVAIAVLHLRPLQKPGESARGKV
jgi:AraC family transcriptional regulator of adaptative response / DNA-3-methyladenine glycosylase II